MVLQTCKLVAWFSLVSVLKFNFQMAVAVACCLPGPSPETCLHRHVLLWKCFSLKSSVHTKLPQFLPQWETTYIKSFVHINLSTQNFFSVDSILLRDLPHKATLLKSSLQKVFIHGELPAKWAAFIEWHLHLGMEDPASTLSWLSWLKWLLLCFSLLIFPQIWFNYE